MSPLQQIELRVSGLAGELCQLQAEAWWQVRDAKAAVEATTSIPSSCQRLLCGTSELRDTETLGLALAGEGAGVPVAAELTLLRRDPQQAAWLQAVQSDQTGLPDLPGSAWADGEVVLAAVSRCGWALERASLELRSDRDVVLAAVRQNGLALKHAGLALAADRTVALEAVVGCERALEFADACLRADRGFVREALARNGRALRHAEVEYRSDKELVLIAVRQCGLALAGASATLRADCEVVEAAVLQDPAALALAAGGLRDDPELRALAAQVALAPKVPCGPAPGITTCWPSDEERAFDHPVPPHDVRPRAYSFGAGGSEGNAGMKRLLGAEGAGVCELANLGLPVVPGFCLAPQDLNANDSGGKAEGPSAAIKHGVSALEQCAGRTFGGAHDEPLLLCVRGIRAAGGACLPGYVTNIGLNDEIAEAWEKHENPHTVWDSYRRLIASFARDVRGLDAEPFERELERARGECASRCELGRQLQDFELPTRALRQLVVAYKRLYASLSGEPFPQQPEQQLLQALGSLHGPAPALVQAAVHGQAAGFVPAGGAPSGGCWWEQAQADDVGGGRAGQRRISQRASREWAEGAGLDEDERVENFSSLEEAMPAVYAQLVECQDVLSRHMHGIQGVDFVVRDGQVWLLRPGAPCAPSPGAPAAAEASDEATLEATGAGAAEVPAACDAPEAWDAPAAWGSPEEGRPTDEAPSLAGPPPAACGRPLAPAPGARGRAARLLAGAAPLRRRPAAARPARRAAPAEGCEPPRAAAPCAAAPAAAAGCGGLALPLWETAFAGGAAAFASRAAAAPADRLASLLRAEGVRALASGARSAGSAGLSAGALLGCARAMPTGMICCTAYVNLLSLTCGKGVGGIDEVSAVPRLACAATAATLAGALAHPLDAVAAPRPAAPPALAARAPPAAWLAAACRGLPGKLAGTVPRAAVELCAIDVVKAAAVSRGCEVTPGVLLFSGAAAAVASAGIASPLCAALGAPVAAPQPAGERRRAAPPRPSLPKPALPSAGGVAATAANALVRVGLVTAFAQTR